MQIKEIMVTRLVTINKNDTLARIKTIFDKLKFHHLLVVEGGKLAGIISDRDLLKIISPNVGTAAETVADRRTLTVRAYQMMSTKIVSVTPDTDVKIAIQLMLSSNVSCLPVLSAGGVVAGLATWKDFLKAVAGGDWLAGKMM